MREEFRYMAELPGTPPEQAWVRDRLETLSAREGIILTAAARRCPLECAADTINCLQSLEDCTLLETRCILLEAGNFMRQYDSVTDLVRGGDHLGITLEEQGQGEHHWMEKLTAALEYENCRTLKFALDISQNLHCYDWVPSSDLAESAVGLLLDAGMSEDLICSCGIDLAGYKSWLLENEGYFLSSNDSGYICRNDQEFCFQFSSPASEQFGITGPAI